MSSKEVNSVLSGLQKVSKRLAKSVALLDAQVVESIKTLPQEERLEVYSAITQAYQTRVAQVPTLRHHLHNTRRRLMRDVE